MATASLSLTPECSICVEIFKTPKVLTCGHTFCLCCIEKYIGGKKTFRCPICQKCVNVPKGGAKKLTTNFIVPTSPHTTQVTGTTSPTTQVTGTTSPSTQVTDKTISKVKYHCPCHEERPIDYYCLTCHCVLCHKCFVKKHNGHKCLDVECETAKEKSKKLVLTSEKFIQNKIKYMEKKHAELVEAKHTLWRFTGDAFSRITKQTDKIIEELKAESERVKTQIKKMSEESESELIKNEEKIMGDIQKLKLNLKTNFPSLTEDCGLQILVSLEKLKKLEELVKDVEVRPLPVKYYVWEERKYFSLRIDRLGSTLLKQFDVFKPQCQIIPEPHISIPNIHSNSYQFCVDIHDMNIDRECFYGFKNRFDELVWSFLVLKYDEDWMFYYAINVRLSAVDNPKLKHCIIDYKISLLNIDDASKNITHTYNNAKFEKQSGLNWHYGKSIEMYKIADKNNGYLNSNGQFFVQFEITQHRELSME